MTTVFEGLTSVAQSSSTVVSLLPCLLYVSTTDMMVFPCDFLFVVCWPQNKLIQKFDRQLGQILSNIFHVIKYFYFVIQVLLTAVEKWCRVSQ